MLRVPLLLSQMDVITAIIRFSGKLCQDVFRIFYATVLRCLEKRDFTPTSRNVWRRQSGNSVDFTCARKKKKIPLLVTIIIYFRYVFFKAFRGHRKCVGTVRNVHNKSA